MGTMGWRKAFVFNNYVSYAFTLLEWVAHIYLLLMDIWMVGLVCVCVCVFNSWLGICFVMWDYGLRGFLFTCPVFWVECEVEGV